MWSTRTLPHSEVCHLAQWAKLQLRTLGCEGAAPRQAASFTLIVNVAEISCLQVRSRVWIPSPHVTLHGVHSPSTHLRSAPKSQLSSSNIKTNGYIVKAVEGNRSWRGKTLAVQGPSWMRAWTSCHRLKDDIRIIFIFFPEMQCFILNDRTPIGVNWVTTSQPRRNALRFSHSTRYESFISGRGKKRGIELTFYIKLTLLGKVSSCIAPSPKEAFLLLCIGDRPLALGRVHARKR